MDLLGDLRTLMSQREQHQTAIALIDEELEKARRALGVVASTAPASDGYKKPRQGTAFIQDAILTALTPHVILSAGDMVDITSYPVPRVNAALIQLMKKKLVIREKGIGGKKTRWGYLYALPTTVFAEHKTQITTDEEAARALEAESE